MKKVILLATVTLLFVSCNSEKNAELEKKALIDSLNAANELAAKQRTIDSFNMANQSNVMVNDVEFEDLLLKQETGNSNQSSQLSGHHANSNPNVSTNGSAAQTVNTSNNSVTTNTAPANNNSSTTITTKKGMSAKTKGALIGAAAGVVTGAAAGAIIDKKDPLKGGVIGGVIGGAVGSGVGYGTGTVIDNKNKTSTVTTNP